MNYVKLFLLGFLGFSPVLEAQNLPNQSFENWIGRSGFAIDYREPISWTTSNVYSSQGPTITVEPSSDAYAGDSAMLLTTLPLGFGGTPFASYAINGIARIDSGSGEPDVFSAGTPVAGKPLFISGYYKFQPFVANDSAHVEAWLSRWTGNSRQTVAHGILKLGEQSNYSFFQLEMDDLQTSQMPDTITLIFYSSDPIVPKEGAKLWVDELRSDTILPVSPLQHRLSINIYPNPGSGMVNVQTSEKGLFQFRVMDLFGKQIRHGSFRDQTEINLLGKPPGIYFLEISGIDGKIIKKIILD